MFKYEEGELEGTPLTQRKHSAPAPRIKERTPGEGADQLVEAGLT